MGLGTLPMLAFWDALNSGVVPVEGQPPVLKTERGRLLHHSSFSKRSGTTQAPLRTGG